MSLALALGAGATPGTAAGLAWSVEARWPAWTAAIEARALLSLRDEVASIAVSSAFAAGSAVLCMHRGVLFGCGRAELGALRFESTEHVRMRPESSPVLGLAARLGAEWPLAHSLGLRTYVDALAPATGSVLWLDEDSPTPDRALWRAPPATVTLGVGLVTSL